jgi:short subunit dehydrogenase-like uncharacterized protein
MSLTSRNQKKIDFMSLDPEIIKLISYQVLNCVGPYRFYGEVVVKACVENGAHHIDISGNFLNLFKLSIKTEFF